MCFLKVDFGSFGVSISTMIVLLLAVGIVNAVVLTSDQHIALTKVLDGLGMLRR
jgi:hypothetical protein